MCLDSSALLGIGLFEKLLRFKGWRFCGFVRGCLSRIAKHHVWLITLEVLARPRHAAPEQRWLGRRGVWAPGLGWAGGGGGVGPERGLGGGRRGVWAPGLGWVGGGRGCGPLVPGWLGAGRGRGGWAWSPSWFGGGRGCRAWAVGGGFVGL